MRDCFIFIIFVNKTRAETLPLVRIMKYLLLFFACLSFISCEKAVEFDLDEPEPKLVVEATIETGGLPTVILTRSQNYFAQITPDILASSFVQNADVYMSNGIVTNKFMLNSFTLPNGSNFYYYRPDPSNAAIQPLPAAVTACL